MRSIIINNVDLMSEKEEEKLKECLFEQNIQYEQVTE